MEPEQEVPEQDLTPRQLDVLHGLVRGETAPEMAAALNVTTSTVNWHLDLLYKKIGAHNRVTAFARALNLGLVELPRA